MLPALPIPRLLVLVHLIACGGPVPKLRQLVGTEARRTDVDSPAGAVPAEDPE
jgi:hypothetical protein